jgi:asparagine synthase (glutamine-hydrolysing)
LSGIAGILHRDGAPALRAELQPLVDSLQRGGAGVPTSWHEGRISLGSTSWHSAESLSHAAVVLDPAIAHLQAVADIRLDARADLVAKLISAGSKISAGANDTQLLLHAYAVWEQDCLDYLRGDFAFAIWDTKALSLFCARDHFGIKPFYYADLNPVFIFANAIDALRRHPQVSGALNDSAVADFLLFGLNTDNATTTFRDIQRLPPAHSLLVSRSAATLRRYWNVPASGRIRYSRASEYVENFLHVWNSAVADRLAPGTLPVAAAEDRTTGILLSGGLDSSAVAATANCQLRHGQTLRAFSIANEFLLPDSDSQFAAAMANSLGVPFEIIPANLRPFEHWDDNAAISPEPVNDPLFAGLPLSFRKIAAQCSVLLSGEGADNLMHFELQPYVADLLRRGEWLALFGNLAQFARRRPFPWKGLRSRVQGLISFGENTADKFPKWISPDFAARLDLQARWRAGQQLPTPPHRHPIHPIAQASMYLPQWTRLFELENSSVTKSLVQVRYPFLDLRVVEYLLAIPPFPWFFEKTLLRQAMADRVLDTVRLRPKTPFVGDPLLLQLQRFGPFGVSGREQVGGSPAFAPSSASSELSRYINSSLLSPLHAKMSAEQVNQMARPICFNFWLQSVRRVAYN